MEEILVDRAEMKKYILNKFTAEGDFDFLKAGELEAMVDAMAALDEAYMQSVGEGVYDDDEAYARLFAAMQQQFPDYKAYCMRLCEDYMDFSEEYLVSIDAIDWE